MENDEQVDSTITEEETFEESEESEDESEDDTSALKEQLEKEAEARRQLTARVKKEEARRKELEAQLASGGAQPLDVSDYIDISASLEGLDGREKEYLAKMHKLTGTPLRDLRNDEDFLLWQGAHRNKVEKENTLKPSGTQTESDKPKSLSEQINAATMSEKEALLEKYGLYKSPRPRTDSSSIGR